MKNLLPKEAIIAVTLNCNSRCITCDIWKSKIINESKPEFYKKLPSSLEEINVTGGEPFLRNDLSEIIAIMKETCPKARILINTNGYLVKRIKKIIPEIMKIDPTIAIRVSIDGEEKTHNSIRRLPDFYNKAIESLNYLRSIKIKDLGISYTLIDQNKKDLIKIYNYCERNNLDFSLTVATDSPIYFGKGKINIRPKVDGELKDIFNKLYKKQYLSLKPKNWTRAWFNKKLIKFIEKKTRYFICDAGKDFFYLDSLGKVYICHLKPWYLGNLHKEAFNKIFFPKRTNSFRKKVFNCNDCWMVCTVRASIKKNFIKIFKEILEDKLLAYFNL